MKLAQDNGGASMIKRTVEIDSDDLEMEIRKHFRCRKGDLVKRFFAQGSSTFDRFIAILIDEKGYKELGGK
jgi:hypothetical protein